MSDLPLYWGKLSEGDKNALRAEREAETYRYLYDTEVERQRQEWEEEFGRDNPRFPFKPANVHQKVIAQMKR